MRTVLALMLVVGSLVLSGCAAGPSAISDDPAQSSATTSAPTEPVWYSSPPEELLEWAAAHGTRLTETDVDSELDKSAALAVVADTGAPQSTEEPGVSIAVKARVVGGDDDGRIVWVVLRHPVTVQRHGAPSTPVEGYIATVLDADSGEVLSMHATGGEPPADWL